MGKYDWEPSSESTIVIGEAYQGGIIAYILVSGDPGFDAITPHGLIAANTSQSTGILWRYDDGNYNYISTGATGTAIGTGLANTNTIIVEQSGAATSYAAGLARAHNGGGYTDWYLPSEDELDKLYINRVAIGGFTSSGYWSSTDAEANAWYLYFADGVLYYGPKNNLLRVRAIRAF